MRVCFILERAALAATAIFGEAYRLLESRGAEVFSICPEIKYPATVNVPDPSADVYILGSGTERALSMALAFENRGARVINSVNSNIKAKDRVLASSVLMRHDIPTLKTVRAPGTGLFVPSRLSDAGNGSFQDKSGVGETGDEIKVLCIGEKAYGVRKSPGRRLEAIALTKEMEDISIRCGKAFGLEFYGIYIKECGRRVYVRDVKAFPACKGVPEAAKSLSDYIMSRTK